MSIFVSSQKANSSLSPSSPPPTGLSEATPVFRGESSFLDFADSDFLHLAAYSHHIDPAIPDFDLGILYIGNSDGSRMSAPGFDLYSGASSLDSDLPAAGRPDMGVGILHP